MSFREDFGGKLTSRFGWSIFLGQFSVKKPFNSTHHLGDLHLLAERALEIPTDRSAVLGENHWGR